MRPVRLGERVLGCQEALSSRAVSLPFGIFLERIRHSDGPVAEVLAVHRFNGCIRCIKAGEIDEGISLGVSGIWVTHDLGCLEDHTKGTECVVQKLFIDLWVQVTNEDVGTNIQVFVVGRGLVYSDGFAIEFDHIHNFNGVICILFAKELHKAIALMLASDSVFRHVCVDHRPGLQEKLP